MEKNEYIATIDIHSVHPTIKAKNKAEAIDKAIELLEKLCQHDLFNGGEIYAITDQNDKEWIEYGPESTRQPAEPYRIACLGSYDDRQAAFR